MGEYINIELQRNIEQAYSKEGVRKQIFNYINTSEFLNKENYEKSLKLYDDYFIKKYYDSKRDRINEFNEKYSFDTIYYALYYCILTIKEPELFTSVVSKFAGMLDPLSRDNVTTCAEVLGVLCATDIYDIFRLNHGGSFYVRNNHELPKKLQKHIAMASYLPPMVCKPKEIIHNKQSGYLTFDKSVILGKRNHHNMDQCLDVLNIMANVPLTLNTQFLSKVEEEPQKPLDTQQKRTLWDTFKKQSYYVYRLLVRSGNKFYFNYRVDKRGRIYSSGYHVNPQGSSFKKAMLDFHEQHYVDNTFKDVRFK